jgi:23S rRNA (cytidine1920-2'-O)/16S rRNA (cytidine1409-2'-O)-methyltransferase
MKAHTTATKKRLDLLLVERGLAETRHRAQAVILAGNVRVAGQRQDKAGAMVPCDATIEIAGDDLRYASRGGRKLEGALEEFAIDPAGRICMDVGSSTGGFTDCLLQHGAERVYAVDVTISQLAWKLQRDPRVIALKTNARYLAPSLSGKEGCTQPPSLVTVDLSFISVGKVLPSVVSLAAPGADFLILVKPQFELERKDVGRGGIVRDAALHQRAIENVRAAVRTAGLTEIELAPSRLTGAGGNQEFFLRARLLQKPNSDPPPLPLG